MMNLIVFVLLLASLRVNANTKSPVVAAPRHPTFVAPHHNIQERVQDYYHERLHENAEAAKLYDMDNWFDTVVTSCLEAVERRRHHTRKEAQE
mmetsp:Transcript_10875/g.20736  ORF Transcript_10875/g.20736 Transcript_10875/m.20736 type:complete len:93 (+) Transcript_10875:156-434(+)|eukprot:scaffold2109_cov188-Amphora_coffeaeformis.AAC.7